MYLSQRDSHDRSLARSAWESVHRENRPSRVRYDRAQLNPELFTRTEHGRDAAYSTFLSA